VPDIDVNLKRLRYFTVLADELHFGRAAERLHMAQPGLSQQIKTLEGELGVRLFERTRKFTRLTPAGELLRSEATRLLRDAESVVERVRARASGITGSLTVAYTRSAVYLGTTELVRDFREAHPDVLVRTTSAWTSRNLEMLHDHEVDVAFVRTPVDDPTIELLRLAREELVAVVPDGHPLARRSAVVPADLVDEDIVFWPREFGPGYYDSIIGQIWTSGPPRVILEEPDDEQILAAVSTGIGVSVLERRRATRLRPPKVTLRRFAEPVPTSGLAAAWRRGESSPTLDAFLIECRRMRPIDGRDDPEEAA
jgi:DNA-binding transcriptional LysR family regulator